MNQLSPNPWMNVTCTNYSNVPGRIQAQLRTETCNCVGDVGQYTEKNEQCYYALPKLPCDVREKTFICANM